MDAGDLVLMTDLKTSYGHLVRIGGGTQTVKGLGVLDFDRLRQHGYGDVYEIGSLRFRLTRPTLQQALSHLERKAQIITEKDIPHILFIGDVPNARLVIEGGIGSGFLTAAVCSVLRPGARLVTYEIREDFAKLALGNLERLGLRDRCTVKIGDITKGIEERDADVVVVDIPNPADCVPAALAALRAGGVFISYAPAVNQMEACVRSMRAAGFSGTTSFETLLRRMVVGDQGTRPDFEMLGHTGYLTYGYR